MIKTFNYPGNKKHIISDVNELIEKVDCKIYFEPFLGSGTIFANTQKTFDEYHINDITKDIYDIFISIRTYSYTDFKNFWDLVHSRFGDIKLSKESFYTFRDWYNRTFYFIESPVRGIGMYVLANSVINSYLRAGPNGINQSWGHRKRMFTEPEFNILKSKLLRSSLTNTDASNLFENPYYNTETVFAFLDPPYYGAPICYNNDSNKNITELTQKYSLNTNAFIVYTDVHTKDYVDSMSRLNIIPIKRKLGSNKTRLKKSEAIYTNIHYDK